MGTWDVGPFDNDTAADFCGDLEEAAAGEREGVVRGAHACDRHCGLPRGTRRDQPSEQMDLWAEFGWRPLARETSAAWRPCFCHSRPENSSV